LADRNFELDNVELGSGNLILEIGRMVISDRQGADFQAANYGGTRWPRPEARREK
jgi:hypothetical protein